MIKQIIGIVAMDDRQSIGFEGALPWRIPEEMAHFRDTTMGHSVLMGRVTFESLPAPLEGRQTIVLTSDRTYSPVGAVVAHTLAEVYDLATQEKLFVAGGASVYEQTLDTMDELIITRVAAYYQGDKFFPNYQKPCWETTSLESFKSESTGIEYDIRKLKRVF